MNQHELATLGGGCFWCLEAVFEQVRGVERAGEVAGDEPVHDLHRLVEGRPLMLGGVNVPAEKGSLGHSDADVVCHAVTDAILGAARAGDIGQHFPDTDPRWKGAPSTMLLEEAVRIVRAAGWIVDNVDVVVILERPKLAPHRAEMESRLASAIGRQASGFSFSSS